MWILHLNKIKMIATQTVQEYPKDGLKTYLEKKFSGRYHSASPEGFLPSNEFGRVAEDLTIEDMRDPASIDLEKQVHEAMLAMGFIPRDSEISGGFLRYKRSQEDRVSTIFINCSQNIDAAWGRITVYDLVENNS